MKGAKQICSHCTREATHGRKRCGDCLQKKRTHERACYNERVSRGQCPCCVQRADVGIFCFTHWLRNIGLPHGLGNKKGIALLQQLWREQQGRCAVTGDLLQPGLTASLDHIVPKSRGGSSTKGNLRWVLLRVNQCKWDMTHEEFVDMCRRVVREQDRREVPTHATMRSN